MHHRNHQMAIITMAFLILTVVQTILCQDPTTHLFLDDLDMGIARTGDLHPLPGAHELILLPNALEFPRTALHSPASHAITLFNNHHNKTVYLNSVVVVPSEALHNAFHVSFVRDQAVPPQGNVTFTVIFLATRIGPVNTELLVRTNFGQLKYQVTGVGVASPFKVVPLTHLVSYAGLNSSSITIPDISLYNPYNAAIQITEIFSSGGKFYLELPGDDDADRLLWTIEPYQKKAVIRVRFTGSIVAGNYSAYIRLKLVSSVMDLDESVLVIPIHMEVREQQPITLYPERSLINLGSVLLSEKRHPLHINFYQSHTQEPDIGLESMDWETELSIGEATTRFHRMLDCNNIVVGEDLLIRLKIECDLDWMDVIRNVSQSWDAFIPGAVMQVIGGVTVNSTVRSRKTSTVHRIPLFAELISGSGIELPPNVTVLFPTAEELTIGLFYLRNNFDSPIVVASIRVEWKEGTEQVHPVEGAVQEHFQSVQDDFPRVLKPGESYTMASVTLPMDAIKSDKSLTTFSAQILIQTNVTAALTLPLYGYSGKFTSLMLHNDFKALIAAAKGNPKESQIVTAKDVEALDFGVVRLDIETWRYMALLNENPVPVAIKKWSLPTMNIFLYSIMFMGCGTKYEVQRMDESLSVAQPDEWCLFEFSAKTPTKGGFNGTFQYQTNYELTRLPIKIVGDSGMLFVSRPSLMMRNCYPKTVCSVDIHITSTYSHVVRVLDLVPYEHEQFVQFTDEIQPNAVTKIGQMYLNMLPTSVYTNSWPSNIFDSIDINGMEELLRRSLIMFHMLEENNKLPFKIVTDVTTLQLTMHYEYVWPQLIDHAKVTEIVAVVGQETQFNVTIHNPLNENIAYWYYLENRRSFELPSVVVPLATSETLMRWIPWKVVNLGKYSSKDKLILAPGEVRNLTVFVKGDEPGVYSTLFMLKNNFTYLEGTWLGMTVLTPQFKFGNRKPSCPTPLLFEVLDQPNACVADPKFDHPLISTKRVFTAKNTGPVPITITDISINTENCSGHGFVVLNCAPFQLQPNQTHKIEISFVPDFTVSRIERTLIFSTDIDYPMEYSLVGVTPINMLNRCGKVLNRPWWEEKLKKWSLSMMATMAIIVATVAFFESLKILKDHSEATYRQRGPFQPPLDFKKLTAAKTATTTTSSGNDSETSATKDTIAKPPKKKTSSNLFDNKRFAWFIKRSQAEAVGEPINSTPSGSSSSSGSSSDKKPLKGQTKVVDKNTPPNKTNITNPATSTPTTAVEKSQSPEFKKPSTTNSSSSAKKENVPVKKVKVKSKSVQSSKPVEPEQKEETTTLECVNGIIESDAHNKKEVTLLLPKSTPLKEVQIQKDSPVAGTTHGKTPGRERKEKLVQAKRNPPGRANKIALFNNTSPNNDSATDPWTNACRGLFQGNGDPASIATPGGMPYEEPQFRQQPPPQQHFSQNMNFHQEPMNLMAMNVHSQNPPPSLPDETNGCSENPLGAIGTIPPISKSHANYLLALELQERNSYYNSPTFYNDGFDQHVPYQAQNNFPVSTGVNDPFGNFNMDSMYSNQFGGTNDLQGLYAEYQKQQLERLALLQRLALHQQQQQQQQQQNGHGNIGQGSHQSMRDYTSWDLSQDQWRAQRNLEQALQPEQQQTFNRSGLASGPPPGLNARHSDQMNQHNNSQEDASNQYDPLRSIWNQWNSNNGNHQ